MKKRSLLLLLVVFMSLLLSVPLVTVYAYSNLVYDNLDGANQAMGPLNRHVFGKIEGRWWVFFTSDMYTMEHISSTDGITWGAKAQVATMYAVLNGSTYAVAWDGTYFHVAAYNMEAYYLRYVRGDPASDGSVSWGAVQNVGYSGTGNRAYHISMCVDSNGLPWISLTASIDSKPYVTHSTTSGTWTLAGGFPYKLHDTASTSWRTSIVAMASGRVYVSYGTDGGGINHIYGRLYDSGWGSQEDLSQVTISANVKPDHALCAVGDNVYAIYSWEDAGSVSALLFNKRLWTEASWGVSPVIVEDNLPLYCVSTLSYTETETALYGVYYNSGTGKLYYVKMPWLTNYADPVTVTELVTMSLYSPRSINAMSSEDNETLQIGVVYEQITTKDLYISFLNMTAPPPEEEEPPDLGYYVPPAMYHDYVNATWYMRSDTHTVNETLAFKLSESNTYDEYLVDKSSAGTKTAYLGFRAYLIDGSGLTSEITGGNPKAVVSVSANYTGLLYANYTIPDMSRFSVASVYVEVYHRWGTTGDWELIAEYITRDDLLIFFPASMWTVYYAVNYTQYGGNSYDTFLWGSSTYPSCINLYYGRMNAWDVSRYWISKGQLILWLVTPFTYHIGDLFYGLIVLMFCVTAYNRFGSLLPVLAVLWIFAGAGGVLSFLIPAIGLRIAWFLLVLALSLTLLKIFR